MTQDIFFIEKLKPKDKRTFKKIYQEYYTSLCSFAYKYIRDPQICEDIVQEIFIKLWNSSENIRANSFQNFLFTSVRNRCIDYLRKNKADSKLIEEYDFSELESDVEHNRLREKVHVKLYQAISELPPRSREIMMLSVKGYTNKEIEEELNISVNTVKDTKKRAYKVIRENFKK